MKRVLSITISLLIAISLFIPAITAEGEVFVAADNTVLPLTDAMPISSGGAWYVDYQCFTRGNLKISSSYNAADGTLVLYTWDTTLIFDLNTATAYTTEERTKYKQWSFSRYGTVYVPAQFTAQTLGFEYYYFPELPLIRIKKSSSIPNNMFLYIAEKSIPDLRSAYNMSKNPQSQNSATPNSAAPSTPSSSATPSTPATEVEPESVKNIYLTFNITSEKNCEKILDALSRYGMHATFFINGSVIPESGDMLRRMVVSGHALGTLSENGDSDFSASADEMLAALARANEMMFEAAKTKTRLVRVPSGSTGVLNAAKCDALFQGGYRLWDCNVNPYTRLSRKTSSSLYSTTTNLLKKKNGTAILLLEDNDFTVSALSRILNYISSEKYNVRTLTVLNTPVNDLNERR